MDIRKIAELIPWARYGTNQSKLLFANEEGDVSESGEEAVSVCDSAMVSDTQFITHTHKYRQTYRRTHTDPCTYKHTQQTHTYRYTHTHTHTTHPAMNTRIQRYTLLTAKKWYNNTNICSKPDRGGGGRASGSVGVGEGYGGCKGDIYEINEVAGSQVIPMI